MIVIKIERFLKLIGSQSSSHCDYTILTGTLHFTTVVEDEISTLTVTHTLIFLYRDSLIIIIIVSTVVINMQFPPSVHKRQVTITIKSTDMFCTDRNQVTVVSITKGCRHITINGSGINRHLVTTLDHITTGKDRIMNSDTCFPV